MKTITKTTFRVLVLATIYALIAYMADNINLFEWGTGWRITWVIFFVIWLVWVFLGKTINTIAEIKDIQLQIDKLKEDNKLK